jgi:hypothetical protein
MKRVERLPKAITRFAYDEDLDQFMSKREEFVGLERSQLQACIKRLPSSGSNGPAFADAGTGCSRVRSRAD